MDTLINSISVDWPKYLTLLAAFCTAIFNGIRTFRKKKINVVYLKRSAQLIKAKKLDFKGLNITYNEETLKSLTITNIAIWNAGRQTIKTSDITSKEPIRIRTKGDVHIYDAGIRSMNKRENSFKATRKDTTTGHEVVVEFEYMDKDDGVVIQIRHSGINSDDLEVIGTIKSQGAIKSAEAKTKLKIISEFENSATNFFLDRSGKRAAVWTSSIFGTTLLALALFGSKGWLTFAVLLISGIYLLASIFVSYATNIPKDLEFMEE